MTTLIDIALYLLIAGLAFAVAWFAAGNRRTEATAVTEDNMRGTFSQLSSEALTANNEQFITLAKEILAAQQAESGSDLESRKIEIETLLKPLAEQLSALEASTKLMEKERARSN